MLYNIFSPDFQNFTEAGLFCYILVYSMIYSREHNKLYKMFYTHYIT